MSYEEARKLPLISLESFSICTGILRGGWLPITIELNENIYEISASAVMNDPAEELIELLDFVVCGSSGFRRLSMWEESPGGYALDTLARDGDKFELRLFQDRELHPPELSPVAQAQCCLHGARQSVFDGMYHGIENLVSKISEPLTQKTTEDELDFLTINGMSQF